MCAMLLTLEHSVRKYVASHYTTTLRQHCAKHHIRSQYKTCFHLRNVRNVVQICWHLRNVCNAVDYRALRAQMMNQSRCPGCLKLQVSFRKRATDYRALFYCGASWLIHRCITLCANVLWCAQMGLDPSPPPENGSRPQPPTSRTKYVGICAMCAMLFKYVGVCAMCAMLLTIEHFVRKYVASICGGQCITLSTHITTYITTYMWWTMHYTIQICCITLCANVLRCAQIDQMYHHKYVADIAIEKSSIISGSFAERDLQLKASCASWLIHHKCVADIAIDHSMCHNSLRCRVAKTHRMPQVAGLFPQKSH